jgi:sortase (surface protein transpeptidase)
VESDLGRRSPRWGRLSGWLILAGIVLIAGSAFPLIDRDFPANRPDAPSGRVLPAASAPPVPAPRTAATAATVGSAPVRPPVVVIVTDPAVVRVPAIGLDAPVGRLGLNPDGTLQVPTDWGQVGWYQGGTAPGAVGPAVLVGHYDSTSGPAVFYRLGALLPGDRVEVASAAGATVAFTVDRVENVAKSTFPTDRVYGPVGRAELRLITCSGAFDHGRHHYLDNLIVYAHAVDGSPAAPTGTPTTAAIEAGAGGGADRGGGAPGRAIGRPSTAS